MVKQVECIHYYSYGNIQVVMVIDNPLWTQFCEVSLMFNNPLLGSSQLVHCSEISLGVHNKR